MKNLAMAYAIKKKSKGGMIKCAHGGPIYCAEGCYVDGGEVEEKRSSIAKSIMAKKMAKGGEVEDDDVEENFLDDEPMENVDSDLEFPDDDEDEKPGMKTKGILQKILSRKK